MTPRPSREAKLSFVCQFKGNYTQPTPALSGEGRAPQFSSLEGVRFRSRILNAAPTQGRHRL